MKTKLLMLTIIIILLALTTASAQETEPFRFRIFPPVTHQTEPAGQGSDTIDYEFTPARAVQQYRVGWQTGFIHATIPGNYRGTLPTDPYFTLGYNDALLHAEQYHK